MDFAPVHTHPDIFEDGEFFSVLAFNAHVNGVFGHQKRKLSKMFPRVEVFENADLSFV